VQKVERWWYGVRRREADCSLDVHFLGTGGTSSLAFGFLPPCWPGGREWWGIHSATTRTGAGHQHPEQGAEHQQPKSENKEQDHARGIIEEP